MKAIVQDSYGTAEVLRLHEVDQPEPADDEVLVEVRAAGVDPGVWHLMTGKPYLIRVMGFGLRRPKQRIAGADVAGTVKAVGKNVTHLHEGDEVFGTAQGAFAEYATAKADTLVTKPKDLTFEQAAALPVSACTALQALRDRANVKQGQKVLVVGAGGGVGTYAVQLAKAFGAEVTGVCGPDKTDLVRDLGADHVIDYTKSALTGEYDVILDIAGNRPLNVLRSVLAADGVLVLVGAEDGGRWIGPVARNVKAAAMGPFVKHKLRGMFATTTGDDLERLKELVEAGKLTPVVDRTFPLTEAADAVRHLARGHTRGKVVVTT